MNKSVFALLILLAALPLSAAGVFYKAAPYRYYLQSFDPSAGLRSSQPLCITLNKGTNYPVTADLKQYLPNQSKYNKLQGVVRIRKGVAGPVLFAGKFSPESAWNLPWLPAGFHLLELQGINEQNEIVTERELIFHVVEETLPEHERKIAESDPAIFHADFHSGKLFLKGVPADAKGIRL